jgi:hypothetical protein
MLVRALCVWFIVLDLAVIEMLWLGRHRARDGFRSWGDKEPKDRR